MINKYPIATYGISVFFILFAIFFTGQSHTIGDQIKSNIFEIEKRISLDLSNLPLAEPLFGYSGNEQEVKEYVAGLNRQLNENGSRVFVSMIYTSVPESGTYSTLKSNYKTVFIGYVIDKSHVVHTYVIVLMLSVFNLYLYRKMFTRRIAFKQKQAKSTEQVENPTLIIDLYSKSMFVNGKEDLKSQLANKPLCFYLAMLEFCKLNPQANLYLNKELPKELIELADKNFHRLAVLGHIVRKRPNFSNSLEKTLSEIRASLDEILTDYPQLKDKIYPPRAHGEGSRSKLHSYGLQNLSGKDYEVRGK